MKLLSVSVSRIRDVPHAGGTVSTGIFKEPLEGRVKVRTLGLEGDAQADRLNHGGADKAVYAYTVENYAYWQRELGRDDFRHGQFGENLTVEGMLDDAVHVGDAFRVGGALLQITQPRAPCYKLGIRMGSREFPKRFLASSRVGFYLRVLEEGEVGAGDDIQRVETEPVRMTVREMTRLLHFEPKNLEGARRALAIEGLSAAWRESFEHRLAKAGTKTDAHASGRRQ